jgi:hypothetical protein
MRVTWAGVLLVASILVGDGGCTPHPTPPTDPNLGPPPPFVAGTYDCAAPATWKTTTFAGLVPAVQRALASDNPHSALTGLLRGRADEEVTCVAGYIHDESVKQQATATEPELAAKRVAATTAWIESQSAKGLIVMNYGGEAR